MTSSTSSQFDRLADPVKRWVWTQGWTELRDVQERAIPAIMDGGDVILAARTAAGKTEAAFLPLISRIQARGASASDGFSVVYVSPLKALINDQFRRLEGLLTTCQIPIHRWHGDVSADARKRAIERPSGIVLITPESLEATLVRRGRQVERLFGRLDAFVIDELHAFIGSERGRQLQSVLNRIEVATRRERIDRIGLSATLGDMSLAAEELRPGAGQDVEIVESREGTQDILLQIRGYRHRRPPVERAENTPAAPIADEEMIQHMFSVLRGKRNLLFGGSRRNVELFTDRLRESCDAQRIPNEFFAHHGNLSKAEREQVEQRLRDDPRPTTAVATSTLELGIDIGDVESVAQVGPGWSVASLRQRLGRSGRRAGKPAILRIYVPEEEYGPGLHPSDKLRLDLVQAIAMVELLIAKWCEPPRASGLHLSTLLQQTLALICQFGAVKPTSAWKVLCERGPFRSVDDALYARLLKAMATAEYPLLEMGSDKTLMLGKGGDHIAAGHDFYAVFATTEEFRVIAEGKTSGTIPIDQTLAPGQTIIFGGRRWKILSVDTRSRVLEVKASDAAIPPRFGGGFAGVHDKVAETMWSILVGTNVPAYLDAIARELLKEGRSAFREAGLDQRSISQNGGGCFVFPWVGSVKLDTFALALMSRGFEASASGHVIEVANCNTIDLLEVLHEIATSAAPDGVELAKHAAKLQREKYDHLIPDELLMMAMAREHLDAAVVPDLATQILKRCSGSETESY